MTILRPYQERAVDDLRDAFRQGNRAPLLVLPTGGGKTIIFSHIAATAAGRGRQVLILVHRRELITQASRKLAAVGVEHGIIAAGVPASDHPVQVASVQTLARRLRCIEWKPTLIIIDEAHHATAGQWSQVLEHWPDAYRLGVTATPCRLDGRGLRDAFDVMVKGPSMADLIFAGHLTGARIYAPPLQADLSKVRTRGGDYATDQAAEAMNRPTVTGDAISHYRRLAEGQQAIAFCCNVAHAEAVCVAFMDAGIASALLVGNTSDRDAVVADFAAHRIQVLVTVDVVSEGFDVPAASCAILLRPTQSEGLYLQQVGRVLRPAAGKEYAVVLDHVGNVRRHGFPDEDRPWSLDHTMRRRRDKDSVPVKVCPSCFAAIASAAVECKECGHVFEKTEARKLQVVDGELMMLQRREQRRQQGGARSLEDLRQLAHQRGYRRGWAERVYEARLARRHGI